MILAATLVGTAISNFEAKTPSKIKPMKSKVWRKHYKSYLKQSRSIEQSPDSHYKLGIWAWNHGLEDEAWEQWIFALNQDPNHSKTREAAGYVKVKDNWSRPEKINSKWVESVKDAGRALSFTVAIQDDASEEFLDEFGWRIRRLNWFIWDITEGQFYLNKITVEDKKASGRMVLLRRKLNIPVLRGGGAHCYKAGTADWYVTSGGKCYVRILAHEIMHGLFGLPDERHGCYCLMQGGLYGINTKDLELCDDKTHNTHASSPSSCWGMILKRYPKLNHPNTKNYGRAPETEIVVKNN